MKRKQVDDVLGGPDAWANVDKTDGKCASPMGFLFSCRLGGQDGIEVTVRADLINKVQCTREGCDGSQAYFRQVQIRSADEPMTIFFKVCFSFSSCL
jgi:DNA-directed RNA polymerase III subunit RPC11